MFEFYVFIKKIENNKRFYLRFEFIFENNILNNFIFKKGIERVW